MAALRAAVGDPPDFTTNQMPLGVGRILTYAIYWSPLRFIEEILALGGDPNGHDNDGFPPLLAALCKTHPQAGSLTRTDVTEVLSRLLDAGADPNQRGFNDWTALHFAVHETNVEAVRLLLARGADRELRTRIDDCDTPLEMARAGVVRKPEERAALEAIVALLST